MPWTLWLMLATFFFVFDTMIRYVRFKDDPKGWTMATAVTGGLLWGVAWFVLASALGGSALQTLVQAVLFVALYITVVVQLGKRFFAR